MYIGDMRCGVETLQARMFGPANPAAHVAQAARILIDAQLNVPE